MELQTTLSSKGYVVDKNSLALKFGPTKIHDIRGGLYVQGRGHPNYPAPTPFAAYQESPLLMRVPRMWGVEHLGVPKDNQLRDVPVQTPMVYTGQLRDKQRPAYEAAVTGMDERGCVCLELPTGAGKTFIATYIISHYQQRVIIVVHLETLKQQWITELQTWFPTTKIGVYQGSQVPDADCMIVVAMIHSVVHQAKTAAAQLARKRSLEQLGTFGLAIFDECHLVPSASFSTAMYKLNSKRMLGLTATPKRLDGLEQLLFWHLGPICYRENPDRGGQTCHVYTVDTPWKFSAEVDGQTALAEHKQRNEFLAKLIRARMNLVPLSRILVLCQRRAQANWLYANLTNSELPCLRATVGLCISGEKQFAQSLQCDVVVGTYQSVSVGVSVPHLNTLVYASPKSAAGGGLRQAFGRILRKVHTDVTPAVFDLVDDGKATTQAARNQIYRKEMAGRTVVHHYTWNCRHKMLEEQTNHPICASKEKEKTRDKIDRKTPLYDI